MSVSQQEREHYANSLVYKRILCEKEELEMLKWLESEKVGYDIGISKAIMMWRFRQCCVQPVSDVKTQNVPVESENETTVTIHKDSETPNSDLGDRNI